MRHARSIVTFMLATIAALSLVVHPARADDTSPAGPESGPAPYSKFIVGAEAQNGLFNVIRKSGKVYIDIAQAQLGQDYVQTAELVNGLGGYGVWPGGISAAARIIRFTRSDNKIVVTWPNTYFIAPGNEPAQRAIARTVADSPVALEPIAATDPVTGRIVFDASFLLTDVYNLSDILRDVTGRDKPDQAYGLDPDRTFFGQTKAFPMNVVINANQTWKSDNPQVIDNVPDPRSLSIRIAYNIAQPPPSSDYIPRIADDRIGFFDSPHLSFASDANYSRVTRYIIRWNVQPSDPAKAVSPAKNPIVFYLSNEIPEQYRPTIRAAILRWNSAFARAGISDAVQVRDQPADSTWDPDDIRYNTVLWLTESNNSSFAAASPIFDPRTGQTFRANIVIDADWLNFQFSSAQYLADPADRGLRAGFQSGERGLALGMARESSFGRIALDLMGQPLVGAGLSTYVNDGLLWTIMHESGHALGLQHNFIGTQAYTVKQMQSRDFTSKFGLSSSVMDYVGINLWPKGMGSGEYWQTMLGPYDYHAIHWGYARIPGAKTPQDEVSTLNRWASNWNNPQYRFASDEDAGFGDAHAIDPRVSRWDLTNDPLTWSATRLQLTDDLMKKLDSRWPQPGHTYDQERIAFGWVFFERLSAAVQSEHFIAGEFLSRSHTGDPGAPAPLVQIPRDVERRAFGQLNKYVFADGAWNFSPATLNRLVYSEWEPFVNGAWAYDPQPRHDMPVAEMAEGLANQLLGTMFQPLMLERLDDLPLKSRPGTTMTLTDLFDWTQTSIYGDLRDPKMRSIGRVHRTIQQSYARLLIQLWLAPRQGTPYDAQSMARSELVSVRGDLKTALGRQALDELTRAHLESLQEIVSRALDARQVIPAKEAP